MHDSTASNSPAGHLVLGVGLWLLVATTIAVSGAMGQAPALAPISIVGALAFAVVAYRTSRSVRALAHRIDLRTVILVHVLRVPIGAYILLRSGVVPELFAQRAGIGDIAAGALAVGAALLIPARTATRRRLVIAWSVFGLLDLVLAVGTANYLLFVAADSRMRMVGELPWALLPTVAVPVMLASHLLVLARLRARPG